MYLMTVFKISNVRYQQMIELYTFIYEIQCIIWFHIQFKVIYTYYPNKALLKLPGKIKYI